MYVPSDDKFLLQVELSADLLNNVASHHQGVQFFSEDCDTSFGDTIEMLYGHLRLSRWVESLNSAT